MARRPSEHEADLVLERLQNFRDSVAPAGALAPSVTTPSVTGAATRTRRPPRRAPRGIGRPQLSYLAIIGVALSVLMGGGALLSSASGSPTNDVLANSVRAVGGAPAVGPATGLDLNSAVIDIAASPSGRGYWIAAADGGVFAYGDARFAGSAADRKLRSPVVGIAATSTGHGYWLAAADGGVFTFGDAAFYGSLGNPGAMISPIVGMAATPSGHGYWLVGSDGGVFSFGDAQFEGAATSFPHGAPIVGLAPTPSGRGYYLLAADGAVFSFGDARFAGSAIDGRNLATAIAVPLNGKGYLVAHTDGSVVGLGGAPSTPAPVDPLADRHPVISFALRPGGGVWLARSYVAPAPATADPSSSASASASPSQDAFLRCTRAHESDSAGGYRAISPDGVYRGAYQFLRSTWNNVARAAGRADLVGVDPAAASPADQDQLALFLFRHAGAGPWGGRCRGLT